MISPEDESILSAYVDGELDPLERGAIESAMAADPLLSIQVHDLVTVRELVADLPHPAAPDVCPVVLERIRHNLSRPRPWKAVRQNLPWLATALATAAAVVLVVLAMTHRQPRPVSDRAGRDLIADRTLPGEQLRGSTDFASDGLTPSPAIGGASGHQTGSTIAHADGSPRSAELLESWDQERLRSLIDDPRLQRVFLVTDQLGGPGVDQVASVVERTTRHDYFKITISQGIVIDPAHPDHAIVFAVVLDETELPSFRKVLKDRFHDRVQDHGVDPAVALQLADIGKVVSLPPHPEARVTIPDERLAIRAGNDGPTVGQLHSAPEPGLPDSPPGGVQTTETPPPSELIAGHPAQHAARTAESQPAQATSKHPSMGANDHHLIVLVWVTGPGSG